MGIFSYLVKVDQHSLIESVQTPINHQKITHIQCVINQQDILIYIDLDQLSKTIDDFNCNNYLNSYIGNSLLIK